MASMQVGVERRAAQRFGISLPVSIRRLDCQSEEHACTQDLSARGVYLYTDCPLEPGAEVEITLLMPGEITLSESMRVRCRGKVLRLDKDGYTSPDSCGTQAPAKVGVAVHFERYEYLTDAHATSKDAGEDQRLAALRRPAENDAADPSAAGWGIF